MEGQQLKKKMNESMAWWMGWISYCCYVGGAFVIVRWAVLILLKRQKQLQGELQRPPIFPRTRVQRLPFVPWGEEQNTESLFHVLLVQHNNTYLCPPSEVVESLHSIPLQIRTYGCQWIKGLILEGRSGIKGSRYSSPPGQVSWSCLELEFLGGCSGNCFVG